MKKLFALSGLLLLTSCMPPRILCMLDFSDYTQTYEFNISKEELKDRIVSAYTYDTGFFWAVMGKTPIVNEDVSEKYRKEELWLDKEKWNRDKAEIRANTGDTLNLIVGKYASPRDDIKFQVILKGEGNKSSLKINGFKYQQVRKCCEKKNYRKKLSRKIKRKFINKLD